MSTPTPRSVIVLVAGNVLLAAAFALMSIGLNPDSLQTGVLRFLAIAAVGFLVTRGVRWARLLLVVLTGLAAAYAVVTAMSGTMAPAWRIWFFVYGGGTIACLVGLFVQPAAAHFATKPPRDKDGVTP